MAGYGSDGAFATWLSDNGLALPVNAPSPAIMRQRGRVYVDSLGNAPAGASSGLRWMGEPTGGYVQDEAFPRTGVVIGKQSVPDNVVPNAIEKASYYAGYQDAVEPGSLSASGSSATLVKREKVDVIEVEYAGASSSGNLVDAITPMNTTVMGLIRPFLIDVSHECLGIWSIGRGC